MKLLARAAPKKRGRKFRISWKLALLGLPIVAVFGVLLFYAIWAQTFDLKKVDDMPERNTVFDVDGKIYSRLAGANRVKVALNEVSASAKEGASSITQQLARNSLPLGGRTLSRKVLEAMVALRIEKDFTKQQILELYVNRIYFGSGNYGVQTASLAYFGKDAVKLNLSESAILAGLIRSPNRFSPLKNPEGAALQRDAVLDRLVELKKISLAQANEAKSTRITSHPKRMPLIQENYAMDAVQRDLNLLLTPEQIDNGGLSIYTTLDPTVQNAAAQAIESQLSKIEHQSNFKHPIKANYRPPEEGEDSSMPYLQGALVAIDNESGGIRALVGGRDYAQSKFNRALAPANRQIGSSFKPFVYTVAFMNGLLPGAAVSDGPIEPGEIQGAGNWTPGNSDGTYGGIQPVSYGLIHSRNTMSVRIGEIAGLDNVMKIAMTLGLGQNIPRGPAIYIGSFETDLKDLTAAYTVFPNAGVRKQAYIIERIDDADHNPIYRAAHVSVPAVDPGAAWMTSELMEQVLVSGTAASAKALGFKLPAAGKTGTTNDYKDAWFVGYTSAITCGVWVGFDQPQTIVSRGYGAALALPVWTQVMTKAAQRYPARPLQASMPLASVQVCSISNHLATTGCNAAGTAYEITLPEGKLPTVACEIHGGTQTQFAQKLQDLGQKATTLPSRVFQSFRKFFGGK
jgi:penicillin-binding protein 1A